MTNTEKHPLANQTVQVQFKGGHPQIAGSEDSPVEFVVEDWWDFMTGGSWMWAEGNPACIVYAVRGALNGLPMDDQVVYGKVGSFGHLVHTSEILTQDAPPVSPVPNNGSEFEEVLEGPGF